MSVNTGFPPRFSVLIMFPHEWEEENSKYRISGVHTVYFREVQVHYTRQGKYKNRRVTRFVPKKTVVLYQWGTAQPKRPLFSTLIFDRKTRSISIFNLYQMWVYMENPASETILHENMRVLIYHHETINPVGYVRELDKIMTIYKHYFHRFMPNITIEIAREDAETLCKYMSCATPHPQRATIPMIIPPPNKEELDKITREHGLEEIKDKNTAKKLFDEMIASMMRKIDVTGHEKKSRVHGKVGRQEEFVFEEA